MQILSGRIYIQTHQEKSVETINAQAKALIKSTGYDELSLCSLSTSDHSCVNEMLTSLIDWTVKDKINLSLPSLRVDNFSDELVDKLNKVRKSGLTFAPEAGTQRLRDVINKNITEEEVVKTCTKAFDNGWTSVKLYFMMGLPTETIEDMKALQIWQCRLFTLSIKIQTGRREQVFRFQ